MSIFESILRKLNLHPPLWYAVSDRSTFPRLSTLVYLEALFGTRAHVIQWREKDLPADACAVFLRRGVELAESADKIFLVNSLVELALEVGAHGVHLTSRQELPPAVQARNDSRRTSFILGKSVHSIDEAKQAEAEGADYVLLGPVFTPLSKGSAAPPLGLHALQEASAALRIPVFALGGITEANWREVVATGVYGAAGISWAARMIVEATRT